jgi:acetyl/propionyl-CoA carboxylase alpha subunit
MVTGLDLVEEQIRISEGHKLVNKDFSKEFFGWAMEARLCAEDPTKDFIPTPGKVSHIRFPAGPYTRIDTSIYPGSHITPDYDPMIAKIIAFGPNRDNARRRLDRSLMEFTLKGCTTNTMFLRRILAYEPFIKGEYDTNVIAQFFIDAPPWYKDEHKKVALLGAAIYNFEKEQRLISQINVSKGINSQMSNWRSMNPNQFF